jgi:hypothetical protein
LDVVAVGTAAQSAATTPATLNATFYVDAGSGMVVNNGREHNQAEKTGYEEPTAIEAGVADASGSLSMRKARPDFLAWLLALCTGNHSVAAAGSTGYLHTMKLTHPDSYTDTPTWFTMAHRKGNTAEALRLTGNQVNAVSIGMAMGSPVSARGDLLGIGKMDDQHVSEVVAGTKSSTTLALGMKCQGEAVSNVSVICDLDADGHYETPVVVTAVDNDGPSVTITAPSTGGDAVNYRVTYLVDDTVTGYTWADLSALSPLTEFSLQTKNVRLKLFGAADGTPSHTGGQIAAEELLDFNYSITRNARIIKAWRQGTDIVDCATGGQRGEVLQTVRFRRKVRDLLLKGFWQKEAAFSLFAEAIGPEYESGQRWMFSIYIPRLGLLNRQTEVADGVWAEAGDCVVLKDTSVGNLPSVVFQVRNQRADYL